MAEFKKARILFFVIGGGSIDIEYEVGEQTPEEAFTSAYDPNKFGSLISLARDTADFDFVICSTESTDDSTDDDRCSDCEGTGTVTHGPSEVECGTCDGRGVLIPAEVKTNDPDEEAPF